MDGKRSAPGPQKTPKSTPQEPPENSPEGERDRVVKTEICYLKTNQMFKEVLPSHTEIGPQNLSFF